MKDGWEAWTEVRRVKCTGCGSEVTINIPLDCLGLGGCVPPSCPGGCVWKPGHLDSVQKREQARKPELPGWPKMTADQQAEVDRMELGFGRLSHADRAKVFRTLAGVYEKRDILVWARICDHIADAHAQAHVSGAGAQALQDFVPGVRRE